MTRFRHWKPSSWVLLLLIGLTLFAVGLWAQDAAKTDPAKALGGEERGLAFLSTDKPMYRPGEIVWGRAVVLDAHDRTPLKDVHVTFKVLSPKGDIVHTYRSGVQDGSAAFEWSVPNGQAGGEYTLKAEFPIQGFAPAERKFDVRLYRAPRFRTQIEFVRKGYGPGETVTATLKAKRSEGGAPAGATVTVIARLDGQEVHRGTAKIDDKGVCTARFDLPEKIRDGDGTLAFVIRDGGVQETAAKTIPILLNKIALDFYTEGGDMVAGLPTRVYVEARDTRDKPADVSGRVLNKNGATVAAFSTKHEGRGRFSFAPVAGETYKVILDKPARNTQQFALPEVKAQGAVLQAMRDVSPAGGPVLFRIASTEGGPATVVLSKLEREAARLSLDLESGSDTVVSLVPAAWADGVLRATLYDRNGLPRAERLIFRRPERSVQVKVTAIPGNAVPGASVTLEIQTLDQRGDPVQAVVGLAVTDDAVLEKIDKREQAPRLPEQVLLECDVRELRDSTVYLGDDGKSERSLDLLLGTQGWRRFVFEDPKAFLDAHGDAARRVLAFRKEVKLRKLAEEVQDAMNDDMEGGGKGAPGAPVRRGGLRLAGAKADRDGAPRPQNARKEEAKGFVGDIEREEAEAAGKPMADKKQIMGRARRMLKERLIKIRREYAHKSKPDRNPGERTDFTETIYWHAGLKTDETGKATVKFDLSDAITTFRVRADALTAKGALGRADALIVSKKAFYLEPKLPLEITAGDMVEIPVAVYNGTGAALDAKIAAVLGKGLVLEGAEPVVKVGPDGSSRVYLTLVGGAHNGKVAVALSGEADGHADKVVRDIPVVPYGFPVDAAFGGRLSSVASLKGELIVPESVVAASISAKAAVYPSPMATLTEALKGLLREPYGCFEQTSSTTYPNIMIMNYFESHKVADVELLERTRTLLDKGYKRLVGFECKKKGYEWFGGDPGHEALTAYGVMEFADMSKVYNVDADMMQRTRNWLLARRDGKGGFSRNPRALDSFGGAPKDITNAYILWTLLESGETGLETEIAAVKAHALTTDDPYYNALAANILLLVKDPEAESILEKVADKQAKDGAVRGAKTSITRSGGDGLVIETTSLAILAWLHSGNWTAQVEHAAKWLFEKCKGGRFGSTQSTVLALKAILGYDASRAKPKAPGTAVLIVDGKDYAKVAFGTDRTGPIEFEGFENLLTPGKHVIELRMEGGSEMPAAVDLQFMAEQPANDPACQVSLETSLSTAKVAEGETLEANVKLTSTSEEGLPMTVAIVGLPGGLEPRHDQLKELVKSKKVDFYEVRGREVILYWRCLEPKAEKNVTLSLIAAVPGVFRGPASRAYLYYTDELKMWCPGLQVKVERKDD